MGLHAGSRWIAIGALAMAASHCDSFAPSCTWSSVAVDALPTGFPTCGDGLTSPLRPDAGEAESAATQQCQSLCASFGTHPSAGGGHTCCISTWEPDTVVCEEVCDD